MNISLEDSDKRQVSIERSAFARQAKTTLRGSDFHRFVAAQQHYGELLEKRGQQQHA